MKLEVMIVQRVRVDHMFNTHIRCTFIHSWKFWTVLRIRTVSYIDAMRGHKQETDYYCTKCEREWTVARNV